MKNNTAIAFVFLAVLGCREPFEGFDFVGSGTKLVVEAIVTDSGEHGYVRLSYSEPINGGEVQEYRFENQASVLVVDDQGVEYPFSALDSGRYVNNAFRPIFGHAYRLEVSVGENRFESGWERLPFEQAEELDLSFRPDTRQVLNPLGNLVNENRILISDLIRRQNQDLRYHWQFNHFYIYDAYGQPDIATYLPDAERFCYVQDQDVTELMIHEDRAGVGEVGPEYNLDITSIPFGRNMVYDYALEVIRFDVSQVVYDYFESIKAQLANTGGVFDAAPSELQGNISTVSGNLDVLGFFGVFNVTSDRLFFNQEELPFAKLEFPTNDDECARAPEGIDSLNHTCWNCKAVTSRFNSVTKPDWWR